MKLFIEKENKSKNMKFEGTVKDLLSRLKIIPENVVVAVNAEIVTPDTKIKEDDEVKILSVISGG